MFGKSVKLFKLLGFEVRVDWSWLIVAVFLIWSLAAGIFPAYYRGLTSGTYFWMGMVGAIGLFVCIVLHEFGHAIVARREGIPMRGITLFLFGGVAEMGAAPATPGAEFRMAIAGPAVTLVLAGICYAFLQWSFVAIWPLPVFAVLSYLTWINVAVLAFNLIPAFPLDGGRVLRSALWAWKKNLRWSTSVASAIGTGFAWLLIGWGVFNFLFGGFVTGVWFALIGWFIRNASRASYQEVVIREMLSGESVHRFMTENPVAVAPTLSIQKFVEDYIYKHPYKLYPVVESGNLVGCVTADDVKRVPRPEWEQRTTGSIATPCTPENTIDPEADAVNALSRMSGKRTNRLLVVDHGHLLGIVAFGDLANFLARRMEFGGPA